MERTANCFQKRSAGQREDLKLSIKNKENDWSDVLTAKI